MLSTPAPAVGHHSASAEFDAAKRIKITGALTKLNWLNPHIIFYIDVAGDGGKVANWSWELPSPNQLMRAGWTRNSMKIGDMVTVEGHSRPRRQQSRDGDDRDAGQHGKAAVRGKSRRTVDGTRLRGVGGSFGSVLRRL